MKGDWKAARCMLDEDTRLLNAAITKDCWTLLHVAAGANQVHFVVELVQLLEPCDVELKDYNGNTAFSFAAAIGNVQIADLMVKKNGVLPLIRGADEVTPLHMAALQGKGDMARHLYNLTARILGEEDWRTLFFLCIKNGFYDLSLQILQTMPMLALARDENDETGLHVLARKPSDFSGQGRWYLRNQRMNSCMKSSPVLQLVGCLWSMILISLDDSEMRLFISQPSQVIFDAARAGNFHFVAELVRSYPDLIWEVDGQN